MVDFILHLLGLCSDNLGHIDLMDILVQFQHLIQWRRI